MIRSEQPICDPGDCAALHSEWVPRAFPNLTELAVQGDAERAIEIVAGLPKLAILHLGRCEHLGRVWHAPT
jgi:hypothetical protein